MVEELDVVVYASLRLTAPELDPAVVTRCLQLPPDAQHRRGEPHLVRGRKGRVIVYSPRTCGLWSMSSRGWVDSASLDDHVRWLLDEVEPREEALRGIDVAGSNVDIHCFSAGPSSVAPVVSRPLVARAGRLGIEIDVEHYDVRRREGEL